MDTHPTKGTKRGAARLLLFILLAFGVSNVFRFDVFHIKGALEKSTGWGYLPVHELLDGSGICIAGLLCLFLLKKDRTVGISFFGTSWRKSVFMASVPAILLIATGVQNKYGVNAHLFGLIAAVGSLVYCIMEEYGWRGYLQEEFKWVKPALRFLLIGFIWYAWHLSFLTPASPGENLFFLGSLVLGSWGIGKVAELTNSIVACSCFHLLVNVFMFNPFYNNAFSGTSRLIILSVSISLWVIILVRWKKDHGVLVSHGGMQP